MPPPPPRCPPPPPGPPPGPGPPPPPMFNMPKTSKASSGDGRNMLLESIREGKSLKKTVTVDKSAPIIGKVPNISSASSVGNGVANIRGGGNTVPSVAIGAGGKPLAGLFAGGMPKLKSTGRDIGQSNNSSSDSQSSSNRSSPEQTRPSKDIKKSSSSFQKPTNTNVRRQTSTEIKRGPPPQPPALKSPIPNSASDSVLTGPARSEMGSTSSRSQSSNISTLQTKHSFLNKNIHTGSNNNDTTTNSSQSFANKSNLHASLTSLHQTKQLSVNSQTLGQSLTNLSNQNSSNKPVINHGKPNLAPKPPALNPVPTPKREVSRAQSMRVPRTPPSATATQPMWPVGGTLRGVPQGFHQSTENFRASKPAPGIPLMGINSRPTIPPPPRPPASRPPPPPSRSTSNTSTLQTTTSSTSNLTNMNYNHSRSQSSLSQNSVQSNNSISSRFNNNSTNNTTMNVPPPPPPHRNTPAPLPPNKTQLIYGVPAPPVRNSSMRNGAGSDIESRFSDMFHSVSDFPPPMPFYRVAKEYNSKICNSHSVSKQPSLSKPQAPPPPDRMAVTHINLDSKLYASNTSNC